MNTIEKKYELIKFEDGEFSLEVNVSPDEDTVWLTQNDIALLFNTSKNNISMHIKNIFLENELSKYSVVKESLTTAKDGKNYRISYYNLDMILSIGYRVKSPRGNLFRKWANSVLKKYLLTGNVIYTDRVIAYQSNILNMEAAIVNIENRLTNVEQAIYADNNLLIFEGEILEPYSFLIKLFFLAKDRIVIIDNYADNFLLSMLEKITVPISIYTTSSSYINKCSLKDNIKIIPTDVFHDRYIIIDDTTYTMGTSINSIGKKRFTISKLVDITSEMLLKNIKK